jgi:signal transduction histidine kinase
VTAGSTRHQLLQPLMAMIGFAQLLQDQWETITPEQRKDFLAIVERQGQRLAKMISSLPEDLPPFGTADEAPDPS